MLVGNGCAMSGSESTSPATTSPEPASPETKSPATTSPETTNPETTSPATTSPGEVSPKSIKVVGASAVVSAPPTDSLVAPDGSTWVYRVSGRELCAGQRKDPDAEPVCASWERSFPLDVSWSGDAKRIVFVEDVAVPNDEDDIFTFDVETGRLEQVVTSSADDPAENETNLDLYPFFGPGDQIYFFRHSKGSGVVDLYRSDDGGARPVDGGQLGDRSLIGPPLASEDNVWVFAFWNDENEYGYTKLTFDESNADLVTVADLWAPVDSAYLADVVGDTLLVTQAMIGDGERQTTFVVVPGERSIVELPPGAGGLGDEFRIGGASLSPDGDAVLQLQTDREGTLQFIIWRLVSDGSTITAEPLPAGTFIDERLKGGIGILPGTAGWDGSTTVVASGQPGVVVFDVTVDDSGNG